FRQGEKGLARVVTLARQIAGPLHLARERFRVDEAGHCTERPEERRGLSLLDIEQVDLTPADGRRQLLRMRVHDHFPRNRAGNRTPVDTKFLLGSLELRPMRA